MLGIREQRGRTENLSCLHVQICIRLDRSATQVSNICKEQGCPTGDWHLRLLSREGAALNAGVVLEGEGTETELD